VGRAWVRTKKREVENKVNKDESILGSIGWKGRWGCPNSRSQDEELGRFWISILLMVLYTLIVYAFHPLFEKRHVTERARKDDATSHSMTPLLIVHQRNKFPHALFLGPSAFAKRSILSIV
jgi:hypothetical protein